MRRSTTIVSSVLVLALFTSCALREVLKKPVTRTAVVRATCDSTISLLRVEPDTLHLAQNDTAEWTLTSTLPPGATESFSIIPKVAGQWAFDSTRSDSGGQGKSIRHAHMKPDQLHKQYRYNVQYSCTVNGVMKQRLIDPDIIIDLSLDTRSASRAILRSEDV